MVHDKTHPDKAVAKTWQLPVNLVDPVDVKQAIREVEALDNFIRQSEIRESGKQPKLPRTSRTVDELARVNEVNLLQEDHRQQVKVFLEQLLEHAPVVHMSFATDPSAAFTGKVVTWFRTEINPFVLLQVGLQPTIGAGCVLRTPNKYFDLSLRKYFADQRPVLIKSLQELAEGKAPTAHE